MFDFMSALKRLFARDNKEEYIRYLEVEYHIPRQEAEELTRYHRVEDIVANRCCPR